MLTNDKEPKFKGWHGSFPTKYIVVTSKTDNSNAAKKVTRAWVNTAIALDCPFGGLSPGDLIGEVVRDLDLELGECVFNRIPRKTWNVHYKTAKAEHVVGERIKNLYKHNLIIYGSW